MAWKTSSHYSSAGSTVPTFRLNPSDEQSFRYNNRKDMNDYDRFESALSQITGKRLTYEHLTGKDRTDTEGATAPF